MAEWSKGRDTKQPAPRAGKNLPGFPGNNYRHTHAASALRSAKAPFPLRYVSGTRDACGHGQEEGSVTATTIVIADDYADYRVLVRFLLTSLSDTISIVGEAADGEEALTLVRRERPDIVISDLLMPRLNGLDLTRRIKNERPQTKVILMTSYAEACQRVAHVSEADAVVNKLGLHSGLLPAVRDAIVQ